MHGTAKYHFVVPGKVLNPLVFLANGTFVLILYFYLLLLDDKGRNIIFFLRSLSTSSSGDLLLPRADPDTLDPTRLNSAAFMNCMTMSRWSVNTDGCVLLFFGSFCKQVPDLSFSCHREAATSKMAIWNKHIASHEQIRSQAISLIEAPLFQRS